MSHHGGFESFDQQGYDQHGGFQQQGFQDDQQQQFQPFQPQQPQQQQYNQFQPQQQQASSQPNAKQQPGQDQFQAQFQQMNAMAPMAMNMGQQFLGQQADMLKAKADEYIPTTKLRYLFAVDNSYVFHKLKIIAFPWMNSDWALKYQSDANNPVAPRDDVNAHDMYIPTMAFITYILLSGLSLGSQGRFDPEKLGEITSMATGWIVLEVLVTLFALFIIQAKTDLNYLDIISFSGYKFVPMIFAIGAGIFFQSHTVFLCVGIYGMASLCYFLINSLKIRVQSASSAAHGQYQPGDRRRHYITLGISLVQPLLFYIITRNVAPGN